MKTSHSTQDLVELAWYVRCYLLDENAVREEEGEVQGRRTVAEIRAACNFPEDWWGNIQEEMLGLGYHLAGDSRGFYLGARGESAVYFSYLERQAATKHKRMREKLERAKSGGLLDLIHIYSQEKLKTKLGAAMEGVRQWDEDDRLRYLLSGEKEVAQIAGGKKDQDG
jgi:hypothetical protein